MNGLNWVPIYAESVNFLGEDINIMNSDAKILFKASKESGLEVKRN